jgi:peptidoglycan/xylan/chitin deacetylase (PgdA/CDA1 family)
MDVLSRRSSTLAVLLAAVLAALGLGCAPEAPARPVTVSLEFDDGNHQALVPDLLARHGFRATFYINSGKLGQPDYFRWSDLRALAAGGHEIAGHTRTHPNLTLMTIDGQRREICDDRRALAAHGLRPVSFAYPYGQYTRTTKRLVRGCGYTNARRAGGLGAPPRYAVNRLRLGDPFAIPTLPAPVDTTAAEDVQRWITNAEHHGGGWVQVFWHRICPDDCGRYSWPPDRLDGLLAWLRGQADAGRVRVVTVREALRPAAR